MGRPIDERVIPLVAAQTVSSVVRYGVGGFIVAFLVAYGSAWLLAILSNVRFSIVPRALLLGLDKSIEALWQVVLLRSPLVTASPAQPRAPKGRNAGRRIADPHCRGYLRLCTRGLRGRLWECVAASHSEQRPRHDAEANVAQNG